VDQGVDQVLEHHPVGNAAPVAAQEVRRVDLGRVLADHRGELDPDRFEQAGWNGRHEPSGDH
jgi:hypothetical protein